MKMDGISGTNTDLGLDSRVGVNELSFGSYTSSSSSKPDRTSQGSVNRLSHGQLGRHFTDTPDNFNEEDEEQDETDIGLEYGTSGLALPHLRTSMTPWRSTERAARSDSKLSSPTSSRPATRNSLFSVEGGYTATSTTGSTELEQLQKQLTTYKLKVRTLLELIKQLNYGDDEQKVRDSFYGKLLATMSQYDEIEEMKKTIEELESKGQAAQKLISDLKEKLSVLQRQLLDTKNEHAETLDYANEYLEHSEVLAKNIDDMLTLLMDNLDVPEEERDALQKARQISSSFAMVKMNAVMSTFRRVLSEIKDNSHFSSGDKSSTDAAIANSTAIGDMSKTDSSNRTSSDVNDANRSNEIVARNTSYALDDSVIDTRLEVAIEGLHEEYDKFIHGIREKVEVSANLEKLLLNKLSEQDKLLSHISTKIETNEHKDAELYSAAPISSGILEDSGISKSYKDHIDSLNSLIQELNITLDRKSQDLELLRDKLQEFERLRKSENRLKIELQDHKELAKVKDRNWENFTNDLEKSVSVLQNDKIGLLNMVDQLSAEVDTKNGELEQAAHDLKKSTLLSGTQMDKIKKENQSLEQLLRKYTTTISELTNEGDHLKQMVTDSKKRTSWSQKCEIEFHKSKQHLLLHLEAVFAILGKILQQKSIDQSKRKLEFVRCMDGITEAKSVQSKLESLYNFVETALESIVESYMRMIIAEKDKSRQSTSSNRIEMQLRIDELERKWVSERERRNLDNDAADTRINQLEAENELLREKLYNMTIRK